MKKHLSGWQDNFTMEDIQKWCGEHSKPWKVSIRKHIQDNGYKSVLDVGAGACSEYYGFKDDAYEISYAATEITPKYVEAATKEGIDITLSDMKKLPFPDNQFDCCICSDVMTHQLEYEESIGEMLRVARKEVIITFFKPFLEDTVFGEQVTIDAADTSDPSATHTRIGDTSLVVAIGQPFMYPPDAHTSGKYPVIGTPLGALEKRVSNDAGETICIYHFFHKGKFIEYLDTLNVQYTFEPQAENHEKTTLFLTKKDPEVIA